MYLGEFKQNTAATIPLGQIVLASDGATPATSLSLVRADIQLKKRGGTMAQKNETTNPAHDSLGVFNCLIDATDTNTTGPVDVYVNKATALPIHHNFSVITADEWDRKYATTGPVMDSGIKARGTAQSVTATEAVLAAGEAFTNNILNGNTISIEISAGIWQERSILTTTLSNDKVTFDAMDPVPTGTPRYKIYVGAPASAISIPDVNVTKIGGQTASAAAPVAFPSSLASPTNITAAAGVALSAGGVTAVQSGLATSSALSTVAGYIDTEVAAIKAKTDNLPAAPAAVSDIPTATAIRNAILNWEPFTGYSLARMFRVFGIVLFGTKTGSNTTTEVFTAPAGGETVTATVDADGNRSAVVTTASGTP